MAKGRSYALGFAEAFDEWFESLSASHRRLIDAHMRHKASDPQYGISLDPDDKIRHTFVRVGGRHLWGYRIDYEVTSMAVIVLAGKSLYY